jgi:hypothetical protein
VRVSRRSFLCAAGPAAWLARAPWSAAFGQPEGPGPLHLDCALVGAHHTALAEFIVGYASALEALSVRFHKLHSTDSLQGAAWRAVFVPGCINLPEAWARDIVRPLESGALVVLESNLGVLSEGGFEAYRSRLRRYFGLEVAIPRNLWSGVGPQGRVPYVDYDWPVKTKIRDFSTIVPIRSQDCQVIARVEQSAVACRKNVGRGTLVFLGSPLGPALRAGDAEAARWLCRLLQVAGFSAGGRSIAVETLSGRPGPGKWEPPLHGARG